jgi:hypothetical protein
MTTLAIDVEPLAVDVKEIKRKYTPRGKKR